MKNKILFPALLMLMCITTYAQKHKKGSIEVKCKLVYDKEFGRDLYENLDSYPQDSLMSWLKLAETNFKAPDKTYKAGQNVRFTCIVEADGKPTFAKLRLPANDKEIEEEVKRLVELLPPTTPARCNGSPVASVINIQFPLNSKK